jgi:hypothetical protein
MDVTELEGKLAESPARAAWRTAKPGSEGRPSPPPHYVSGDSISTLIEYVHTLAGAALCRFRAASFDVSVELDNNPEE